MHFSKEYLSLCLKEVVTYWLVNDTLPVFFHKHISEKHKYYESFLKLKIIMGKKKLYTSNYAFYFRESCLKSEWLSDISDKNLCSAAKILLSDSSATSNPLLEMKGSGYIN